MSKTSKEEYLESCRARYRSRKGAGRSAMIDEVSDTLGWNRKHTIKALNGQVSLGGHANKRGSKPTYKEGDKEVIVKIWRSSEQPCGKRLKSTIPLWLGSYEKRYGILDADVRARVIGCSPRQLDRITAPHKVGDGGRCGRKTGRTSHRLKTKIVVRCGPWDVDRPGWMEADTVSHGGGSSSGNYMNTLTLTDIHTGWTELVGLWGQTAGEVCQGVGRVEERMPFEMLGFDCDNGSEFLNTTLEYYLMSRTRKIKWTRSRAYKKNDQAHVEQKNFTHVRQLLGYGRFDDVELVDLVNDLYENAWLPLRNYFTPMMKLLEKTRVGAKVKRKYDKSQTPCDRLLACPQVSEEDKATLKIEREKLDPFDLADLLEEKLKVIFQRVRRIEDQRDEDARFEAELMATAPLAASAGSGSATASVAIAPCASAPPEPAELIAKSIQTMEKSVHVRVS